MARRSARGAALNSDIRNKLRLNNHILRKAAAMVDHLRGISHSHRVPRNRQCHRRDRTVSRVRIQANRDRSLPSRRKAFHPSNRNLQAVAVGRDFRCKSNTDRVLRSPL